MTCYIVGAGEFYGRLTPTDGDLIIAADGGYLTLAEMGIRPHLLIGDMDSLGERELPKSLERITHPVEKDETDAYLAYRIGVEKGYRDFRLYGGVGGRPDHTFANYSLLLCAKNEGNNITLIDKDYEIFVIKNEKTTLSGTTGKTFSVFAVGGDATGVSIIGAKYSATDVTLTEAFPLGVSNSFTDSPVTVSVSDGALLIMKET